MRDGKSGNDFQYLQERAAESVARQPFMFFEDKGSGKQQGNQEQDMVIACPDMENAPRANNP